MTEAEEAARRVKWDERRSLSMHRLTVPNRPQLLEALGRLAIAHTHLERILRYAVKTLSGLSGPKSLDPTKRKPISDLRKRIKKRFKKHHPTAAETYRLDELLEKAKLLSGKRNSYMHRGGRRRSGARNISGVTAGGPVVPEADIGDYQLD